MRIEELRVGNYVRVKYFAYDEVDTHNEITGITEEHPFVNGIVFIYLEYDEIEPIPLTEEWLLKFGFKLDVPFYRNDTFQTKKDNDGFLVYQFSDFLRRVYYVHQLQNLYFALTGQEL